MTSMFGGLRFGHALRSGGRLLLASILFVFVFSRSIASPPDAFVEVGGEIGVKASEQVCSLLGSPTPCLFVNFYWAANLSGPDPVPGFIKRTSPLGSSLITSRRFAEISLWRSWRSRGKLQGGEDNGSSTDPCLVAALPR